ncbi:MAG: hypothetical protein U0795_11840 [Pirellulales bacterium]
MSGAFQLLAHAAALGGSIGISLLFLSDRPWALLVFAMVTWMAFWFHLADAAWIPTWGKGHDWIDRIGILVRGSGLALITAAILSSVTWMSIVLALLGLTCMIFGRALCELVLERLGFDLHSSKIERSKAGAETTTNNPIDQSGGSTAS